MTHDISCMIRGTKSVFHSCQKCGKQIQSSIRIHKFKFECLLTVLNPSLTSYWILVQSFCNAQTISAVCSYCRSNSSTAITFSRLRINQLYIVLRSNQSLACHLLLVCVANVRGMTHLNSCTGPLKGTSEWDPTRCMIIAKPINSLDHAAYAHYWCRSVESLILQKQQCTYRYLDVMQESMWLSVPRAVVAISVSCNLASRYTDNLHAIAHQYHWKEYIPKLEFQ